MNKRPLVSISLLISASVAVALSGCASTSGRSTQASIKRALGFGDNPYLAPFPEAPQEYHDAFAKLEKQDYAGADEAFEKFQRDKPTTNWALAAQFNQGRANEALGRYKKAAALYQSTAERARTARRIQGLSLLRLAVVLEAMGEDDRSLAALKDAEKRASDMPDEVALTELPARLAAAYARERNFKEAEKYFAAADKQLARLRAQASAQGRPEWLPRILYAMGHRPPGEISWDRFESSVVPLERSQGYLLQSAEFGAEPWATLAADELIDTYAALRKSIDSVPVPAASEIVLAAREQQRLRWERLVRLSDAIERLKTLFVAEIFKTSPVGSPIRRIGEFVEDFEETLQSSLMLERPVGESATPDSQSRKDRRVRTIDAKPVFPGEGSSGGGD